MTVTTTFFNSFKNELPQYFDISHLGIIEVKGIDAAKLLQNQCTINVQKLPDTDIKLSAICNLPGRVISLFFLLKKEETYYLILAKDLVNPTIAWLKKYAVFHKITIKDVTSDFKLYGFFKDNTSKESYYSLTDNIGLQMTQKDCSYANLLTSAAWDKLLLSQHYPRLSVQSIGKYLPFELGLLQLNAIDFDKGCYLGQEIIARMYYRSKKQFNIRLALIQCRETPLYCDIVEQNKQLKGVVIDALPDDTHYLALLSIKDEIKNPLFLLQDELYHIELLSNFGGKLA